MDDRPYCDHPEPAVLQATLSTQLLRNGCRNATSAMAAEGSKAGSFTGGAAAAEARVDILGIGLRSSAVQRPSESVA